MVEETGEDVKDGRSRFDQLLQSLGKEGGTVDGREEDGLHLVVPHLIGRLVGDY